MNDCSDTSRIADSIEAQYRIFCAQHDYTVGNNTVEFLGINLNGGPEGFCTFKLYYNTAQSLYFTHQFIDELRTRNMLSALNRIIDSESAECIRYEIGLANRTNENMNWLFSRLADACDAATHASMMQAINALSELRITDDERYSKAAMYFLGFKELKSEAEKFHIDTLKLHYLLRRCLDPDTIGKNFIVDNVASLHQLKTSGLLPFERLINIAQPISELPGCEVWMAAIDFFSDGRQKHKIYLKKCAAHGYEKLAMELMRCGAFALAQIVRGYEKWVSFHQELEQYGLAVCLDSTQRLTVNFYH